jgi:hypothetical protein
VTEKESIPIGDYVSTLTLEQFIYLFVMVEDKRLKKAVKCHLYPAQLKIVRKIDWCIKNKRPFAEIFWACKARQIGFSSIFAMYFVWKLIQGKRYLGLVISGTRFKSEEFTSDRIVYMLNNLVKRIIIPIEKSKTGKEETLDFVWPWDPKNATTSEVVIGEARLKSLAASKDSSQSFSADDIMIDEMSHDNLAYVGATVFQSCKDAIFKSQGFMFCLSTFNVGTFFNNYSKEIIDGRVPDVHFFFADAFSDPQYTREDYNRDLAQAADEYLFKQQRPLTPEDAFLARSGLIFPTFDDRPIVNGARNKKTHVKTFFPRFDLGYQHLLGYDPGYSHESVLLFALYDPVKDHMYIYDELVWIGDPISDRIKEANDRLEYWRNWCFNNTISEYSPYHAIADTSINREGKTEWRLWDEGGITFVNAIKEDRDGSRVLLQNRFHLNNITIHDSCVTTIRQVKNLRWKPGVQIRGVMIKKDVVQEYENDAYDVLRYLENYIDKNVKISSSSIMKSEKDLEAYSKEKQDFLKDSKNNVLAKKEGLSHTGRRPKVLNEKSWEML